MKRIKEFDFKKSRPVTFKEVLMARKAIEKKLGVKRLKRGRPPKGLDKYNPIQIRLHPQALQWAKFEAERRHIGYQTVINETLLSVAIQR